MVYDFATARDVPPAIVANAAEAILMAMLINEQKGVLATTSEALASDATVQATAIAQTGGDDAMARDAIRQALAPQGPLRAPGAWGTLAATPLIDECEAEGHAAWQITGAGYETLVRRMVNAIFPSLATIGQSATPVKTSDNAALRSEKDWAEFVMLVVAQQQTAQGGQPTSVTQVRQMLKITLPMHPDEAKGLQGRTDQAFDQKIRNLVSHAKTVTDAAGRTRRFVMIDDAPVLQVTSSGFTLTSAGIRRSASNLARTVIDLRQKATPSETARTPATARHP